MILFFLMENSLVKQSRKWAGAIDVLLIIFYYYFFLAEDFGFAVEVFLTFF